MFTLSCTGISMSASGYTGYAIPYPGGIQHYEAVCKLNCLSSTPINSQRIRQWTNRDPLLSLVKQALSYNRTLIVNTN